MQIRLYFWHDQPLYFHGWLKGFLLRPTNASDVEVALRFLESCGIVVMGVILEQCRTGEVGAAALRDPAAIRGPRCGIGARP